MCRVVSSLVLLNLNLKLWIHEPRFWPSATEGPQVYGHWSRVWRLRVSGLPRPPTQNPEQQPHQFWALAKLWSSVLILKAWGLEGGVKRPY